MRLFGFGALCKSWTCGDCRQHFFIYGSQRGKLDTRVWLIFRKVLNHNFMCSFKFKPYKRSNLQDWAKNSNILLWILQCNFSPFSKLPLFSRESAEDWTAFSKRETRQHFNYIHNLLTFGCSRRMYCSVQLTEQQLRVVNHAQQLT